jgi:hypothetical protein
MSDTVLPTDHIEDARNLDRKAFIEKYKDHYDIEVIRQILIREHGVDRATMGRKPRKTLAGLLYDHLEELNTASDIVSELSEEIWEFRFNTEEGQRFGKKAIIRKHDEVQLRRILIREFGFKIEEVEKKAKPELVEELAEQLAEFHRIIYDAHVPAASPMPSQPLAETSDDEESIKQDVLDKIQADLKRQFGGIDLPLLKERPRVIFESYTDGWERLTVRSKATSTSIRPAPECQVLWGKEVLTVDTWNDKIDQWYRMFPRISTRQSRNFNNDQADACWKKTDSVWLPTDGKNTRSALNPFIPASIKSLFRIDMWGNVITRQVRPICPLLHDPIHPLT